MVWVYGLHKPYPRLCALVIQQLLGRSGWNVCLDLVPEETPLKANHVNLEITVEIQPLKPKENHLNQTSIKLCSMLFLPVCSIWVFPKNTGTPKWMVFIWKTLLKWMIWGYHYCWKHPYS